MYDVDASGSVNLVEMINIISTMDDLEGEEVRPGMDSPAERLIYYFL